MIDTADRESMRRARSAACSAPRSSALNRIERLYSARVLRALTTRTRVRTGHGKCKVVATAAPAARALIRANSGVPRSGARNGQKVAMKSFGVAEAYQGEPQSVMIYQ